MVIAVAITCLQAFGVSVTPYGHIQLAIPTFLYTIFAQAFVMFYFVGVSRLVGNIYLILDQKTNLKELFENPPEDLSPYLEKSKQFVRDTDKSKRQTIPWTMLILVLGMIAFLLGGAHDTGMVSMHVHSGVVYGFIMALAIGFVKQWQYLGKTHRLLRKVKTLFSLPDAQM